MNRDVRFGDIVVTGLPDKEPIFILRGSNAASDHALRVYEKLVEDYGDGKEAEDAHLARRRFRSYRVGMGI